MWFAHRLNDWSKLAKERVKRATDSSQDSQSNLSERTSTSSDDNLPQKDIAKSANSSFEVRVRLFFEEFLQLEATVQNIDRRRKYVLRKNIVSIHLNSSIFTLC
jgi:hypothetical protein